jgi:hypothetical protein
LKLRLERLKGKLPLLAIQTLSNYKHRKRCQAEYI